MPMLQDLFSSIQAMKELTPQLACLSVETKNRALSAMAKVLEEQSSLIIQENRYDLENARETGLAGPLVARLEFQTEKIFSVIQGIQVLAQLPDPVGQTISACELDAGLNLYQVSCPIGVIGFIFESRPDALIQMACLALKSGNAIVLKGGCEARKTNNILANVLHQASVKAGIPEGWLLLAENREEVKSLLTLEDSIDLLIPRGSNEFVRYIMANTTIPVLGHSDGICHIYVDQQAVIDMAISLVVDSKTEYVAACNSVETLLVHRDIAPFFLPPLKLVLDEKKVKLYGCEKAKEILPSVDFVDRWDKEYLDYILSVKIVDSLDEAISHINHYGSRHTDAIVTSHAQTAESFLQRVDSADVFWNCSTRFADGFRFGLGAEVGISTSKIHARGPVGLQGLVTYKWKLYGHGQTVHPYTKGSRLFTHKRRQL